MRMALHVNYKSLRKSISRLASFDLILQIETNIILHKLKKSGMLTKKCFEDVSNHNIFSGESNLESARDTRRLVSSLG
jgi:hypothetical protein